MQKHPLIHKSIGQEQLGAGRIFWKIPNADFLHVLFLRLLLDGRCSLWHSRRFMFPVIFLNTLTRLGVLPHFLENLSLSPSRLNLDKECSKQECSKKCLTWSRYSKENRRWSFVSFHSHRGDRKKILHAARKQISRKRFSLYVLQ